MAQLLYVREQRRNKFLIKKIVECEWGSLQENNKCTNRVLAVGLDI